MNLSTYFRTISFTVGGLFSFLIIVSIVLTGFYTDYRHHQFGVSLADSFEKKSGIAAVDRSSHYLEDASIAVELIETQISFQPEYLNEPEKLLELMTIVLRTHPNLYSVYIGMNDGSFHQARRGSDAEHVIWRQIQNNTQTIHHLFSGKKDQEPANYDPRLRPWYTGGVQAESLFWTEAYIFDSVSALGITASLPVKNGDELIGVIGADITLQDLGVFLSKERLGPDSRTMIVNKEGAILAHPNEDVFFEQEKLIIPHLERVESIEFFDSLKDHQERSLSTTDEGNKKITRIRTELKGQEYVCIFIDFPAQIGSNWTLITYAPIRYFIGPIGEIRTVIGLIGLLVLLLALMFSSFLSRYISTPIIQLSTQASKVPSRHERRSFGVETRIIEVRKLSDALQRMQEGEEKLLEVTSAISAEIQLVPLLKKVMEAVTEILDADRSTLFLYDNKTQELWSQVAEGVGSKEIRFSCDAGIAGHVFMTGNIINIKDAYRDKRFNTEVDKATGYRTKSILCMQIINKSGVSLGVVQVLNKREGPFTEVDEMRLSAFSAQVAIAIENAQLFKDTVTMKNYNEAVLESMHNGLLTTDENGVVLKTNSGAEEIFSPVFGAEKLVQKSIFELFTEKNGWISEQTKRVLEHGGNDETLDAVVVFINAKGEEEELSINLSIQELVSDEQERIGCILLFEDISREKRIRSTMAQYLNKDLTDKLLEEGSQRLGGTTQKASVLFSDIRSFTTFTERNGPQETVQMLNHYFTEMYDQIIGNDGILDKYIGDAIMAVFGTPFVGPQDADNAVQAGIDMIQALKHFNESREKEGLEIIDIGIGINTGEVVSGNIGSDKRMDFTVIGDGVNLAARLEGATKSYSTPILISRGTKDALTKSFMLREVDFLQVKGKTEPVSIFEVVNALPEQEQKSIMQTLENHNRALEKYRMKDWEEAKTFFKEQLKLHPADRIAAMYLLRVEYFMEHPPPDNWNGVWVMKNK